MENKYWRFYFLTCTTCIVYQYFKELVAFVSKAGAKVRGFILTAKLFGSFFVFSFQLVSQALLRKGKNNHKRKSKTAFFANRTAKIRTFIYLFQTFSELFFVFIVKRSCAFYTKSFYQGFLLLESGCKSTPFSYMLQIYSALFFDYFSMFMLTRWLIMML